MKGIAVGVRTSIKICSSGKVREMVSVKKELEAYGLSPRKHLGQHFLVDQNIVRKIVRTAHLDREDTVLEVGPGLGEMTLLLASIAKRVIVVEIDPGLVRLLKNKMEGQRNIEIVEGDILKVEISSLLRKEKRPVKVVSNLPYQISTPLIFKFIDERSFFSSLTLMLQREVAERMVAKPGSREYGALSVMIQSFAKVEIVFMVKPVCFFPRPEVESAVVQMKWHTDPAIPPEEEELFRKVVRGCLSYRRKTIVNALRHSGISVPCGFEKDLMAAGIDPFKRPEDLDCEQYAALTRIVLDSTDIFRSDSV